MKIKKYNIGKEIIHIFVATIVIIAVSLIYAAMGCTLWGAIIVPVFGLPALTYWQFFGIMVLIRCFIPIKIPTRSIY